MSVTLWCRTGISACQTCADSMTPRTSSTVAKLDSFIGLSHPGPSLKKAIPAKEENRQKSGSRFFCVPAHQEHEERNQGPWLLESPKTPVASEDTPCPALGLTYHANTKAWMTTLKTWLKRVNHQMRTQNRKILLFMDNCGAHPHLDLSHIELAFLPPNTTSKLQPMDAGIIQATKMTYRKMLLRQCPLPHG